ncbi:hypothetical protein [Sorangium sp. So ce1389]|uniref:hypothetical protein n=1 Tax=Sorangium sp. So ce1389 TaxID=3133336 RepID=UPI003F5F2486
MSDSSKPKDPLIDRLSAEVGPDRVHYALGTMLDAQDFQDEQLYHRGRLARALAYLFGAGTVAGLEAAFKRGERAGGEPAPDLDEVIVTAGLALDPFGRLIEVPRPACIRLKRWLDHHRQEGRVGVLESSVHAGRAVTWLFARFVACERGKTPVISQGPFDATNALAPSRIRDGYELGLFLENAPDLPAFPRAPDPGDPGSPRVPASRPAPPSAAGSPERLRALKEALLKGYGRPVDRKEDPGWVLLARVDVPVREDLTYAGAAPAIDNLLRPFAYPAWLSAWNAGLELPSPVSAHET